MLHGANHLKLIYVSLLLYKSRAVGVSGFKAVINAELALDKALIPAAFTERTLN